MGWWEHGPEGHSFVRSSDDDDNLMLWGDGPADIIDNAIHAIKIEFLRDLGRMPSKQEIIAGIMFSTAVLDDLAEEPKDAPHADEDQHEVITEHGYAATGGDVGRSTRQIEAGKEIGKVLEALGVALGPQIKPDSEDEKDGPVWTAVYNRYHSEQRLSFASYDAALDFLRDQWDEGELDPKILIYPSGQQTDGEDLRRVLRARR